MSELAGRKNAYTCAACGGRIVTVYLVDGVTPMFLRCRAKADCKGTMRSEFGQVDQSTQATHEWFRPSLRAARRQGLDMVDHVKCGGLDIRPVRSR